ncbi:hypothetical protein E1952_14775 [Staphylococcus aureus]|nr:hypothetical protein E1952_14775 [Staphylococcus aureus]
MSTELNSGTVGGFGHMGPNDPYNDGHSGSGSSGGSFNGGGNGFIKQQPVCFNSLMMVVTVL